MHCGKCASVISTVGLSKKHGDCQIVLGIDANASLVLVAASNGSSLNRTGEKQSIELEVSVEAGTYVVGNLALHAHSVVDAMVGAMVMVAVGAVV